MRLFVLFLLILTAAAQPGRTPDRVLRTETVAGRLTGWEFGDYLWAQLRSKGPSRAPIRSGPSSKLIAAGR